MPHKYTLPNSLKLFKRLVSEDGKKTMSIIEITVKIIANKIGLIWTAFLPIFNPYFDIRTIEMMA